MNETLMLILLALLMLVGSYIAGSIPLIMPMSEEKLQIVSVLGAGLLVGTALAVIIPEGVRSLDSAATIHTAQTSKDSSGIHVEHAVNPTDIHSLIAVSLVLGFVFMLLVDQCSSSRSRDLESGLKSAEKNITATLGLVVHAAADGIALGAAATTAHADVEMIVFLAIMLHKAPAAFGLVTFLMHEGLERNRIRKHLIVFSLSAPVLAMVTYFGIGQEGKETLSSVNATGLAMLFSAGTFLYVATVHVLPELMVRSRAAEGGVVEQHKGLRTMELLALVVGALLPLFLTLSHHH
ncbi:zinc transporter ZIP9 isoform X2 [Schistocerca americana]|uniref:zinc transporter ZIP9 n=1 Tax=Schistocerca cancellata TaxID=274614 RepID=UPI001F4FA050|nr:zinc transporter ZIP9 isoform X2 [Schistocerca americana]XP_049767624.1 zinc transporter ZIP9 [Schistocerca cancellata]XP_049793597.1 zinc transporter ZIP9 [Schistocerca nitens]XP_049838334.1 zinc transporter ZIP9 [Schistocerca gregaria]XP_049941563.1 zinc transporter ZIP9 isoform X2 [Schistocerca serialis cubense]